MERDEIRGTAAMIAAMEPVLDPEIYLFCTSDDAVLIELGKALAISWFRESEGASLIMRKADAESIRLSGSEPMSHIELRVFSSLDGVGLTAAVSSALAACDIACNVVAAYHHDHIFVPAERADEALMILRDLSSGR